MLHLIWAKGGTLLAIFVSLYAFWRGELPERIGAAVLLAGWFITPMVQMHVTHGIDGHILAVDWVVLVAFVILSLWSRRAWTIFLAAFQLDAVASHYATLLSPDVDTYSYITCIGLWGGFGIVFALWGGLWALEKRRKGEAIAGRSSP